MAETQWQLQENALLDLYQIDGINQVEIYYDIEETKAIDLATVALSAVTLVIVKLTEHLIADIYENLKKKLKRVLRVRKHAAKLALDITITIQDGDSYVIVQDRVNDEEGIERLLESAKSISKKLRQGDQKAAKRITKAQLDDRLSGMPRLQPGKTR